MIWVAVMKGLVFAAMLLSVVPACLGQGQVVFGNIGGGVNAPVFLLGTQSGPGPSWNAQLHIVNSGSITPLTPITTFRERGPGAAAIADRYIHSVTVTVPGVGPGENATFVMRIWHNSYPTYDAAVAGAVLFGQSAEFTVTLGGGILPPANLVTLQGFGSVWPEPSVLALGAMGAAIFLLFRRRREVLS